MSMTTGCCANAGTCAGDTQAGDYTNSDQLLADLNELLAEGRMSRNHFRRIRNYVRTVEVQRDHAISRKCGITSCHANPANVGCPEIRDAVLRSRL